MATEDDFMGNMNVILTAAKENGVILRLIGSIATRLHSPSARSQVIPRALTDIDFVGYSSQSKKVESLFHQLDMLVTMSSTCFMAPNGSFFMERPV